MQITELSLKEVLLLESIKNKSSINAKGEQMLSFCVLTHPLPLSNIREGRRGEGRWRLINFFDC